MRLRNALFISVIIHAGVFAPFYNQHLIKLHIEKKNSVIVDYVVLKEIAKAMTSDKEVVIKSPETPRIDISKEVMESSKPPEQARREQLRKQLEARRLKEKAKSRSEDAVKKQTAEETKKEAELKKSSDYISYYQLIREKIRVRLKDNYRYYTREGDVYINFSVAPNGSLLSYDIDRGRSSTDEVLLHITATSLKAVSPFPKIPKSLSGDKMTFSIMVSFRK